MNEAWKHRVLAGAAAVGLFAAAIIAMTLLSAEPAPSAPLVLQPMPTQTAASPELAPATEPAPDAAIGTPESLAPADGRFIIEALGIDGPLLSMPVTNGRVNPPTASDVYLVEGFGLPGDPGTGTVFLATHSGRGGTVGNLLIDVASGTSRVPLGSRVSVDGMGYVVSSSAVIDKDGLTKDERLWSAAAAGQLVLITCLQLPDGSPSQENVVIFAERK